MILRRLAPSEHARTRALYETVFAEDDKAFVDYYYEWKTRDSRIYVAEEEHTHEIRAMVHLNPFRVYVKGEIRTLHYIVAVATQEEYRHQGLMRRLLALAEEEMREAGEEFTFLMPASEKIYAPFGYRYFCTQRQGILRRDSSSAQRKNAFGDEKFVTQKQRIFGVEKPAEPKQRALYYEACVEESDTLRAAELRDDFDSLEDVVCREVLPSEYGALSDFVNAVLREQYEVFIYRDAPYYERLCAEQRCQNGAVMAVCLKDGTWIGTFCTSESDAPESASCELREVILAPQHCEKGADAIAAFVRAYDEIDTCRESETNISHTVACRDSETNVSHTVACRDSETNVSHTVTCRDSETNVPQTIACRVVGTNVPHILADEVQKPLLMGKRPGEAVFCCDWDEEKIFINEVV